MSEPIAGVPTPPPPQPPRDASVVILYRRRDTDIEVFWLERNHGLHFAGGFYAFPGGKLDERDALISVEGASGHQAQLIAAAARELFEETGVLLAQGAHRLTPLQRKALRRELLDHKSTFDHQLTAHRLTLLADDFKPAGRWVTPDTMPLARFDARFFLSELPVDQFAEVWPGELSEGGWVRPADALERWAHGRALLHPPNLHALQVLESFQNETAAVAELASPTTSGEQMPTRIEFQKGVRLVALRTPTLPPATHTNTYLLGTRQLLVVDPGSPDAEQIELLITRLNELIAEGCTLEAVVLTHHHSDHVGGVEHLVERLRVPVWAHEKTADRVPWPVAKRLHEGEALQLDGPWPMQWQVLHTPGHAQGHITLIDQRSKAAVVGDMVAGVGTIVIDPPEGNMADYLEQLVRLKGMVGTIYPAHGPPIPNGVGKLDEYLTHRAWRETKVFDALKSFAHPVTLKELVTRAYDDVAAFVWPIAERNALAILYKLVHEGRVAMSPEATRFSIAQV